MATPNAQTVLESSQQVELEQNLLLDVSFVLQQQNEVKSCKTSDTM